MSMKDSKQLNVETAKMSEEKKDLVKLDEQEVDTISGGARSTNKCPDCGGRIVFVKETFTHYYKCSDCGRRI